jgi:nitroreductase
MELLSPPKTVLLLDMGIETLHAQSVEWLNEVTFWEIELKFLYDLLSEKTNSIIYENDASDIIKKDNRITKLELKALRQRVNDHEKYLYHLICNNQGEEIIYRENHKQLALHFREMEARYKELKKEIFDLVKPSACETVSWNSTITTIYARRSVRKFTSKTIDKKLIEELIDAARMAPSAMNVHRSKFHVLTNKATIKTIAAELHETVKAKLPLTLINKDHQPDPEDPIFYGAPVVIFLSIAINDEWSEMEAGMCAENLMLAAKSFGIESCAVGAAKLVQTIPSAEKLKIPQEEKICLAIVLGYGDEHPEVKLRSKDNIRFIS